MNPGQKYVVLRPYLDYPLLSNIETELSLELAVDAVRRRRSRASKKYERTGHPSSAVRESLRLTADRGSQGTDEPVPTLDRERGVTSRDRRRVSVRDYTDNGVNRSYRGRRIGLDPFRRRK